MNSQQDPGATDQTHAEAKELSAAESLRQFIDSVTDYAIFTLSPEGRVTSWNRGARRIKGYDDDEILGEHLSRFYSAEDRAAGVPQRALRDAELKGSFSAEGWRIRKDGSRFWASVVIDPVRAADGRLLGFAKITRDLTERREVAAAMERAQLTLFQSQKLEARGQLTGGIAHDFNNLLAVIVNGIALIAPDVQTDRSRRMLASMESVAARGGRLIEQLLAFARQQPLSPEAHDVNALITAFEPVLRRSCPHSLTFEVRLGTDVPAVLLDATQFEAALLNLLTNARDAMSGGGLVTLLTERVTVTENMIERLPAGDFVRVTVADSGTGMTDEVRARAIEPFFTTKAIGAGTGMGLSQVYGLSRQSGGDLQIESAPGKGTRVSIWLPVMKAAQPQPEGDEGPQARALVVDDNADVRDVAAELFRSLGYDVVTAEDGQAAREILTSPAQIEVLFSDIAMPRMDGLALAGQARDRWPELEIILASGYPWPTHRDELRQYKFIQKPYRLTDIIRQLRQGRVRADSGQGVG